MMCSNRSRRLRCAASRHQTKHRARPISSGETRQMAKQMNGVVDSWSASAGTGIILGQDGESYAFGKSDVIEAEPTLPGAQVGFTASREDNPPKATGIQVLRGVTLASAASIEGGVAVTDIRLPFRSVAVEPVRESCRQRVCPYVEIGVVAES